MSDQGDVAILGAGPYGLSLAAHLRASGVPVRHFGMPMELWQSAMPQGMFLKSQGFASNLSSPDGEHTLEAFCAATGRAYASYGLPVPLDTFVAYGKWFQRELVPDVEETMVADVAPADGYFDLTLADGRRTQARTVAVAVGVQHFASVPEQLTGLPPSVCTHSSAHTDLASFRDRKVVVLGAGQSALESGALLSESGANVHLVAREPKVVWNGPPLPPDRPWWRRMREPEAGLGSGWSTWFYSGYPELFRHLPQGTRIVRARTALGPAGARMAADPGGTPISDSPRPHPRVGEGRGRRCRARTRRSRRCHPRADGRPRDRGNRIPQRCGEIGLHRGSTALRVEGGGRHAGSGSPLPVVSSRSLLRGAGRGPDVRTGDALRVRHGSRRQHGIGSPGEPGKAPTARRGGVDLMTTQDYAPLHDHVATHPPGFPAPPTSPTSSCPGPGRGTVAGPRRGRMPSDVVLALLDAAALAAAVRVTGVVTLPATVYALGVLVVVRQPRRRICQRTSDQVGRILTAAAAPLIVVLPWLTAVRAWHLALCSAALVIAVRVLSNGVLRAVHRRGKLTETTLVVGAGETGVLVAELATRHSELGLRPVGFLDSCPPPQDLPLPVLGPTSELPGMIRRSGARRVIVCFAVDADGDLVPALRESQRLGVDICLVPRLSDIGSSVPPTYLDDLFGVPLIPLRASRRGAWAGGRSGPSTRWDRPSCSASSRPCF